MELNPKNLCPLDNFAPCRQLDCAWFTKLRGMNPNTGQEIDEYACSVAWLPVLLIENAQKSRETGAAVESLRNVLSTKPQSNKFLSLGNFRKS